MVRLAEMATRASLATITAALAKRSAPQVAETVAGPQLLGGNGIVADYNVGRFFADAEALTHTSTYQMQKSDRRQSHHRLGAFVEGAPAVPPALPAIPFGPLIPSTGDATMDSQEARPGARKRPLRDQGSIAYVTVNRRRSQCAEHANLVGLRKAFEDARDDAAIVASS